MIQSRLKLQLKDIQNTQDERGIDIQHVGVRNVEVPLILQRKNNDDQVVSASATMSVSLPREYRGTHMSRFMEILTEWGQKNLLGVDIQGCLEAIKEKLQADSATLKFEFKYFIEKAAPVSGLKSPMGYNCSFEGILDKDKYCFILGVEVPVTTLCPCSKEISDYGAHNQRTIVRLNVSYNPDEHMIWIEDLIELVEKCGSSPIFPLLKREDEKYVTELAYNNPRFVEDILREVTLKVRELPVTWFEVDCEALESIHNHSAWAYHKEKVVTP